MSRRERRAAIARAKTGATSGVDTGDLIAQAHQAFQQGRSADAETICKQVLTREPAHVGGLNLLGLIAQTSGRHKNAVRMFASALASDDLNAACHYNIASSYQVLDRRDSAAAHFKKAIALGLSGNNAEDLILQNSAVARFALRTPEEFSRNEDLLDGPAIATIANDIFLQCALTSTIIRGGTLELFLTRLRSALLYLASAHALEPAKVDDRIVSIFCALAEQCFINEYVFSHGDEEFQRAGTLQLLLLRNLSTGAKVSPLLIAAVAAYFPLHSLPVAVSLLDQAWPECVADLLRQQLHEPLEEAQDRIAIPALTAIDDDVSLQVMRQYDENPYPRWTINPPALLAGGARQSSAGMEILIAGCGTGQHSCQIARYFSEARILAVDISLASLAYARRKTREAGLQNIEYAQVDILKLSTIGRTFDRIEAVGVLHHLADPEAGWSALLSLLRKEGVMRVGLYSDTARRSIVEAREIIAARGYRATPEDIRRFRQTILADDLRWKMITATADFYSVSGCRDLLFNLVEHRFTIPRIMSFLNDYGLSFLGFELGSDTMRMFQKRYPADAALLDLNLWNDFEAAHPKTFLHMYKFSVCKN